MKRILAGDRASRKPGYALHPPDNSHHVARLTVETEHAEDIVRIRLHGTAEASTLPELEAAFAGVALDGQWTVQIDVSGVEFLDVPALRRLVAFARESRESGHSVTTRGAQPILQRMTTVLEVDDELGLS